jgi:hypothetical protein
MKITKRTSSSGNWLKLVTVVTLLLLSNSILFAQNYEWEIEKHRRIELEIKKELDSLMVHLKNNWQISLS